MCIRQHQCLFIADTIGNDTEIIITYWNAHQFSLRTLQGMAETKYSPLSVEACANVASQAIAAGTAADRSGKHHAITRFQLVNICPGFDHFAYRFMADAKSLAIGKCVGMAMIYMHVTAANAA